MESALSSFVGTTIGSLNCFQIIVYVLWADQLIFIGLQLFGQSLE